MRCLVLTLCALLAASEAGAQVAYYGQTLSQWSAQLRDGDTQARATAADALGALGPVALPALPQLVATLKDRDAGVRAAAARAMGHVAAGLDDKPTHAAAVVPALIASLKDEMEARGSDQKIEPVVICCDTGVVEYDRIISTIPLDALLKLTGVFQTLSAHEDHCFHITTDALDFEGASQVLVADGPIGFYKVDRASVYDYIFHNLGSVETPFPYFSAFIPYGRFRIIGDTKVPNAIPKSPHAPKIPELQDRFKIDLVGSCAQWDDFMDIASCVWWLLQLKDKP
jgi:hypothetical protein